MQAFNAPYSMIMLELDAVGMLDTEVENRGKVFVTTELGGGGSATPRTVAVAKRGLRNVLHHAGILQGAVEMRPSVQRSEEHTSELQSLMRISYAVFCLKKKKQLRINIWK